MMLPTAMREHRFALATAAATYCLLVIGGLVHATGSSLACPDWPLCEGQFFPAMVGGVLFEHGHRLAALTVGLLTVVLAALVWRRRSALQLRALAVLAVGLVLFQASLGAITVVMRLPLIVSAGHLATSMAFFSLVIYLAWRLRPEPAPAVPGAPRRLAAAAAAAVYGQIVLGALVRHTGSGLACNVRVPLCNGTLWPSGGPAQLHMAHRILGVMLAALVLAASVPAMRAARAAGRRFPAVLAAAAPVLVAAQIALGFLTVTTFISVPVVTVHLALGALLLADALALFLSLGPRSALVDATSGGRQPGLAPAAG
jgi:heme A synthase